MSYLPKIYVVGILVKLFERRACETHYNISFMIKILRCYFLHHAFSSNSFNLRNTYRIRCILRRIIWVIISKVEHNEGIRRRFIFLAFWKNLGTPNPRVITNIVLPAHWISQKAYRQKTRFEEFLTFVLTLRGHHFYLPPVKLIQKNVQELGRENSSLYFARTLLPCKFF